MLTFLRKIRQSLIETGSATKYLLYAIGEIALVVIGILIALQINNWNTDHLRKKEEQKILAEIRGTLETDLSNFLIGMDMVGQVAERIEKLQQVIQSGEHMDSIETYFGAVYGIHRFDLNTASFEELKSSGFNLISDDRIRRLIIKIYDTHLKNIDHFNFIENNVTLEAMRPYYLKNFINIRFSENAEPKDIEMVISDDYFLNLIDYRLTVLKNLHIKNFPGVISDIQALIGLIDGEIGTMDMVIAEKK